MKIGILGTGMVGRAHAAKLVLLGHEVMIGTQDPEKTLAETAPDSMGNVPLKEWQNQNQSVQLGTFGDTAAFGEIVYNALKGEVALGVLRTLALQLEGKVLIDIANPLDFSKGMPPTLAVCNTDSLGEQIQKALPNVHVVKTFNTVNAFLQVDPQKLANADHALFVSGNSTDAKAKVVALLETYGWRHVIDLGDITTARGTEMILPLWLRLWTALQTPMFNFKVVTE